MELIKVTRENLESEHICCAIAGNKDYQVRSKKVWMESRFNEGLVFLKGDVRGKCFIEYIPAEYAWAPIDANHYLYINCLWVSGQFKGYGYSNLLLDACINGAKSQGKQGLVILSSKKKRGFLADPAYLRYKGFIMADTANPDFILMYLPLVQDAVKPQFKSHLKNENPPVSQSGFSLYYTNQCPFTAKYVPLLEQIANQHRIYFHTIHIHTTEQAQHAPSPFTTFSLFYNGKFITHEILSEKKFLKLLEAKALL